MLSGKPQNVNLHYSSADTPNDTQHTVDSGALLIHELNKRLVWYCGANLSEFYYYRPYF